MKKIKHTFFKGLLATAAVTPLAVTALASCGNSKTNEDVVILFTNDTHCSLVNNDTGLGWAQLKGYRDWLESKNCDTLLVDSGDFAQGGVYGTLSQGKYLTDLMNLCEYDLTIPGNHEFDYGMARFNEIRSELKCPMISCNFRHLDPKTGKPGDPVLEPTAVLEAGGKKIGFVGVTTPESLISSNPENFQDQDHNYIYTFLEESDPKPLVYYSAIQTAIDSLHNQGVDYVIGLTHLGVDIGDQFSKYTSEKVIENTTGFDVVLDGHSHTYQTAKKVKDKAGSDVFLTQTGTAFQSIGQLIIHDKQLAFSLVDSANFSSKPVQEKIDAIKAETDGYLSEVKGHIEFDLQMKDADKHRLVRKQETNLGDFMADAVKDKIGKIDDQEIITICNGGAIRENIKKGDVTVGDLLAVAPFGNSLGVLKVKGSVILDALEYSVYKAEKEEFGGFLQVGKGLKFTADLTKPTPVVLDKNNGFDHITGTDADRRVNPETVTFNNEKINRNKDYYLGGSSFQLFSCGDGYNMFRNQEKVPCVAATDTDTIIDYFAAISKTKDIDVYQNVAGQGRITLIKPTK